MAEGVKIILEDDAEEENMNDSSFGKNITYRTFLIS